MHKKMLLGGLLVWGLAVAPGFAAPAKTKKSPAKSSPIQVLTEGSYTAKVKALVCGGCGPLIKQTMNQMESIGMVSVDQSNSILAFTVKKGAQIKRTDLQKALSNAANGMGMGANFDLLDLQPAKKVPTAKT